jgi:nicotinamidase-related amidase
LHAQAIDTLVLAGLTTECCVASTAWDGFEQDFHVFIAADACAAYEPDLHRHALKALEASGAVVADTSEFGRKWK